MFLIPVTFFWGFISGFFRNSNPRPSSVLEERETVSTTKKNESDSSGFTASDIRLNRSRLLQNYNSNNNDDKK